MLNKLCIICIFLVSCGGGNSSSSNNDFASVTNLPAVPSVVCSLKFSSEYPEIYIGPHQIPVPESVLSPQVVQRSISFKDYYGGNSFEFTGEKNTLGEATWNGCTQDEFNKKIYTHTLMRMKDAGANLAWIYNYAPWIDDQADNLQISVPDYQISDQMIEWIVREANGMGIEIYFAWQFWGIDKEQDVIYEMGSTPDLSILKKIMDAHELNIVNQAVMARAAGITGIAADWNAMSICFCGENSDELKEYYIKRIFCDY